VPYRYLALAPVFYRSAGWGDPIAETILPATGPISMRLSWMLGAFVGRVMGNEVNPHRSRLGLQPYRNAMDAIFDRAGRPILSAQRQLAPIPADVTENIVRCGAIRQPDGGAVSEVTERYLADGEPPVFVGFGSMMGMKAAALETLASAIGDAGRRAIFAGEVWDGISLPDGSLRCAAEPHERLFGRVAVVVSHGGAGTVAQALWAGAPQVVVAFNWGDQPYWGRATVAAGVAPAHFLLGKLDASALVRALRGALDGPYAARARALAAEVADVHGAAEVAEEIVRSS